jgi:dihydroneopterin aldolase
LKLDRITPETAARANLALLAVQEVVVRDIRLAADIGVHAHEIGRLQALIVHVALKIRPVMSDCLADTIDYNAVVAHASALAAQRIALIETFAQRLALTCLEYPYVLEADVVVEKPGALANGQASTHVVMKAAQSS